MPQDAQLQRQTPDSLMLFGFWYRALPSNQLSRGKLTKAMLLETPLALGRDRAGKAVRVARRLPASRHAAFLRTTSTAPRSSVPITAGASTRTTGQCTAIPSLVADQKLKVDRIYAGSYPCEERDDFVWVFIPDPGPAGAGFTKARSGAYARARGSEIQRALQLAYLTADLPCSVDHGIIGLMDPAHGPFVHQAWWWRTRHSIHEKQKNFEPIPYGFRMSAHTPSSNSAPYKLLRLYADGDSITTTIDFVLPNMRSEIIRVGKYWFSSLTTVTPITRDHCRIDVVAAWNIFRWVPFAPELLKFVFAKFVEQDRRTMEEQSEGLKHNPHLMLIDDADRPAKWYFGLKQADAGSEEKWRGVSASDERACNAAVEKLRPDRETRLSIVLRRRSAGTLASRCYLPP